MPFASLRTTLVLALCLFATTALPAQQGVFTHNSILRADHASHSDSLAHPYVGDHVTLLAPDADHGYFHVQLDDGKTGWAWKNNIEVSAEPPSALTPIATIHMGSTTPGSASTEGCGDGLWQHVYHPTRLLVYEECITVSGVMVDATATQSHHQADGMRHEDDGDTHGWIKLDPQYQGLINAGNTSDEGGNLVFEFVCHYTISSSAAAAKAACGSYQDPTALPPVGTHVYITGTFVREANHKHWNEIHPVTRMVIH